MHVQLKGEWAGILVSHFLSLLVLTPPHLQVPDKVGFLGSLGKRLSVLVRLLSKLTQPYPSITRYAAKLCIAISYTIACVGQESRHGRGFSLPFCVTA